MYQQAQKLPWIMLREAVTADDTLLTAGSDFSYSIWPTSGVVNDLKNDTVMKDANGLGIIAYGKSADNATVLYNLYGRARQNGPVMLLLTGVMTLGQRVVTDTPIGETAITARWVDTITATGGLLSGLVEILDSGQNRIAGLKFNSYWFNDLYFEVDLDGGGGTAMTEITAILIGF